MNKRIKEVVDRLEINNLREEYYNNQRKILELRYEMNRMTFNLNVARYAWYLDWINYFYDELFEPNCNRVELNKKIQEYLDLAKELEIFPEVKDYKLLREEYKRLTNNHAYYQTINIDLRQELIEHTDIPRIYIRQHVTEYDKNIVDNDSCFDHIDGEPITTIYPVSKMKSKRDFRHFYNKTSFKYLEQVSQDCDYSLDNKRLGHVKVLTK
jgi:hypothetical protein